MDNKPQSPSLLNMLPLQHSQYINILTELLNGEYADSLAITYNFTKELKVIRENLKQPLLSQQEYKVSFEIEPNFSISYTLFHSNTTELSREEILKYSYQALSEKHEYYMREIRKNDFDAEAKIEVLLKTDTDDKVLDPKLI